MNSFSCFPAAEVAVPLAQEPRDQAAALPKERPVSVVLGRPNILVHAVARQRRLGGGERPPPRPLTPDAAVADLVDTLDAHAGFCRVCPGAVRRTW